MACTVPWPIRSWFETRFWDLCEQHDELYVERVWKRKIYADLLIASYFAERGYVTIAFASLPYNLILGTIYWLWKKYK